MTEERFNKDMVIGDVLKANPGAIKVIEKYFGQGCFTCPGMKMESISFGAMIKFPPAENYAAFENQRLYVEKIMRPELRINPNRKSGFPPPVRDQ